MLPSPLKFFSHQSSKHSNFRFTVTLNWSQNCCLTIKNIWIHKTTPFFTVSKSFLKSITFVYLMLTNWKTIIKPHFKSCLQEFNKSNHIFWIYPKTQDFGTHLGKIYCLDRSYFPKCCECWKISCCILDWYWEMGSWSGIITIKKLEISRWCTTATLSMFLKGPWKFWTNQFINKIPNKRIFRQWTLKNQLKHLFYPINH